MNSSPIPVGCALETIIATAQLSQRAARSADVTLESSTLLTLMRALAEAPQSFFQKLVEAALKLSGADSTGISLLNAAHDSFVWPAVAGALRSYVGSGTPRDFGPCGTVLDRRVAVLFLHPEKHFTYLAPITPPLEEVLLVPFFMGDKPVGTIWAVMHGTERKFDAEHKRLLESLSEFAASAYRVLEKTGDLKPMIDRKPETSADASHKG